MCGQQLPSAACELAIPDMTSFYTRMHNYQEVLGTLLQQKLMLMYGKTALLERQLEAQRPDKKLMSHQLIYERLEGRLQQAMRDKYQSRQQQFTRYVDRLSALSPTSRLRGGYVFAQTKEGNPLTSAGQIEKENPFFITFSDGQAEVMPVSVKKNKKIKRFVMAKTKFSIEGAFEQLEDIIEQLSSEEKSACLILWTYIKRE